VSPPQGILHQDQLLLLHRTDDEAGRGWRSEPGQLKFGRIRSWTAFV
jgi:hypothetical protein